jgi:hypothetical protein
MTSAIRSARTQAGTPTRFRESERRGVRLGRMLRLLGHLDGTVDELLMARIASALLARDEPAAALADAIRMRATDPRRVTHEQLRLALELGVDHVADAPPALAEFMAVVTDVPAWVDWELVERGTALFGRLGRNAADVLLQLSLIGGYRFGGPTDLLAATGGLTGRMARRRLAETQQWAAGLSSAASLRPGGAGWRLTVHVRVMHALVNAAFEPKWDTARWGLPINQADQAGTLGLFDGALLIGCRALGVPIPAADAHALMHMWCYVGWLMGVDPEFLTDDEHERHRINYHLLLAAADMSEAGPKLACAALEVQTQRRYAWWPASLRAARGWFERERLLSMLTGFLGPRTMRRLGLPLRPPWAFGYLLPLNTLRYRVLDRLPGGTARRDAWGKRTRDRVLASYFGTDVGDVPVP